MRFSFSLLGLLVAVHATPLEQRQNANPTVTINNGQVIGTVTGVSNQPSLPPIKAYLGVPYAKPPTGSRRFAPPEPATSWSAPLRAQTLPPACLQQFSSEKTKQYFNNPTLSPPAESEDCLYLNVFAPMSASLTRTKAVMFWLYGGNNQFGTASLAFYNGSSLAANEDVVVVAINYRTNMFGFSNSPQIPRGQQNSAFLDQRLALQWVQQNIKQFGGDPARVTIFGESAGGYDVKQLLANPPSPLPFRAAIMQSQNQASSGVGLVSYNQVASNFGCSATPSVIDCLRQVPATDILAYITEEGLSFPDVAGDGTSVGKQALPNILSGQFANVPVLIGTNNNEASVFLDLLGLNTGSTTPATLNATLASYGLGGISDSTIQTFYPTLANAGFRLIDRVVTDLLFTCSTKTLADAIERSGRPIWRYWYEGVFPNLSLFPNAGAWHSSEIPSVWGTYPASGATRTQAALSKYMQGVWAGFAKNPSRGAPWPRLGSNNGLELGVLGGEGSPRGEETRPLIEKDAPCAVFSPLLIAAGQAY
ncbi:Carboxylic ester hydrolase [Cercospora zeina]